MMFMIPRILIVFDHRFRKLRLICNAHIENNTSAEAAYERAETDLQKTLSKLSEPRALRPIDAKATGNLTSPASNTTRVEFKSMVVKAKQLIVARDIFQDVLSTRIDT